jgi:hypothetical protein
MSDAARDAELIPRELRGEVVNTGEERKFRQAGRQRRIVAIWAPPRSQVKVHSRRSRCHSREFHFCSFVSGAFSVLSSLPVPLCQIASYLLGREAVHWQEEMNIGNIWVREKHKVAPDS